MIRYRVIKVDKKERNEKCNIFRSIPAMVVASQCNDGSCIGFDIGQIFFRSSLQLPAHCTATAHYKYLHASKGL